MWATQSVIQAVVESVGSSTELSIRIHSCVISTVPPVALYYGHLPILGCPPAPHSLVATHLAGNMEAREPSLCFPKKFRAKRGTPLGSKSIYTQSHTNLFPSNLQTPPVLSVSSSSTSSEALQIALIILGNGWAPFTRCFPLIIRVGTLVMLY